MTAVSESSRHRFWTILGAPRSQIGIKTSSKTITNKKEIRLSQATRTLRDGDVLRVSDIKPAILVKKGDNILLTIKKGPLQVVVAVEALANGKINDVIPMKNPESGGKLRGRITGTGRATGLR